MKRIVTVGLLWLAGCGWTGGGGGGADCVDGCTFTGTTTAADLSVSSDIALTATAATNSITSDTTAATATSSIAALTLAPTVALAANDLVVEVNSSTGTSLLSVDLEGDVVAGGSIKSTGAMLPAADVTYDLGSSTLAWNGINTRNIYDEDNSSRLGFSTLNRTIIYGRQTNGATAIAIVLNTGAAYSTAGAKLVGFQNNGTDKAGVDLNGFYLQPVQTVTVADDAAGTSPAAAVTPTSNIIKLAYNDVTGSGAGSISETGAQEGTQITIVHTGSGGSVDFADSSGVLEVGTTCTLTATDLLQATYINSAWYVTSCKDNTP